MKCFSEWTEEALRFHSTLMNQIWNIAFLKRSTESCHIDKDVTTNLGKLEGNGFITSRTEACHCRLHTKKSEEPAFAPFKYSHSGEEWQGSPGDNFEIATVSFVAVCTDTVLSIMIERGFLNLKYILSLGREEVRKKDKLKL